MDEGAGSSSVFSIRFAAESTIGVGRLDHEDATR